MVGSTTYFMCLSLFKLHNPFILLNGEDLTLENSPIENHNE